MLIVFTVVSMEATPTSVDATLLANWQVGAEDAVNAQFFVWTLVTALDCLTASAIMSQKLFGLLSVNATARLVCVLDTILYSPHACPVHRARAVNPLPTVHVSEFPSFAAPTRKSFALLVD